MANASRIRERGLSVLAEDGGVELGGRGEARDRPPLARRHPQEERALQVRQRELPADGGGAEGDRPGQRGQVLALEVGLTVILSSLPTLTQGGNNLEKNTTPIPKS